MWNHTLAYGTDFAMWLVMALGTFGFWALVVHLMSSVSWTSMAGPSAGAAPRDDVVDLLDALDVRLAAGEIDSAEYVRARRRLTRP